MKSMHTPIFVLLVLFFSGSVHADSQRIHLWGGGGYNSSVISGEQFGGGKLIAGVQFPTSPDDCTSVRTSISRDFDQSSTERYALLVHVGFRVWKPVDVAFLGGVGYLDSKISNGTYLKPVIGAEIVTSLLDSGPYTVSAYASYQVFRGTTGTLALDGGSDALTTRSFSVGLVLFLGIFDDQTVYSRN